MSLALPPLPERITSMEHGIWLGLHARLRVALERQNLALYLEPTMLILHDLVDNAVKAMHRKVFWELSAADFGLVTEHDDGSLEAFYQAEVSEHGAQNISRYCTEHGWYVSVTFPEQGEEVVRIVMPIAFDVAACKTLKLADALWYELSLSSASADGPHTLTFKRKPGKAGSIQLGGMLDDAAAQSSVRNIYDKLGYGVILFSSTGEILSVSRSMLERSGMVINPGEVTHFCTSIPFNFYNDIIWGLVLTNPGGTFENYRIRMQMPGKPEMTALFNISGYRDEHAVIHTLWQVVSMDASGAGLSEGSILSEVRLHKITRNYVPQLVEVKAREAVRMGEDKLINEECKVAVLFCDIVGFTSYVEANASSESIINTLNTILRRISSSVKRFNGSIDKFMGDCLMAIFRDPVDAVRAAQDMQAHSADINDLRLRAGQQILRLRIGIHWGDVVIGNVGTPERLDWTAIGDVVNTASRIEKNCDPGAILVSRALRDAVAPHHPEFRFDALNTLTVKGKRDAIEVCHVAALPPADS